MAGPHMRGNPVVRRARLRLVSVALSAALAAGMAVATTAPAGAAGPYTFGDFTFTTDASGGATITDYRGAAQIVDIPRTVKRPVLGGVRTYSVTVLGTGALREKGLRSVSIPETVTTIMAYAFTKNDLTEIDLPPSVMDIHGSAFSYNRLSSLTIPGTVKYVRNFAFGMNTLTSVTVASAATTLEMNVFKDNPGLKHVVMLAGAPTVDPGSKPNPTFDPAVVTVYFRSDAAGFTLDSVGRWQGYRTALMRLEASIDRVTVAQGDAVTVSGSGVFPGAMVTAELEAGPVIGTGTATASGKFAFSATVPAATAAGSHELVVTSPFGGTTLTDSLPFVVTEASKPDAKPEPISKPRAKLRRAAAAKLLYQSSNPDKKPRTCASKPYKDVAKQSAACRYISWSKSGKIIKPLAKKRFGPAAAMTRGRLADALYRAAHDGAAAPRCAVKPFKDVKKSSSVCGAVTWAANTGVIPGATAKKFQQSKVVTRGQAAPILQRAAALLG